MGGIGGLGFGVWFQDGETFAAFLAPAHLGDSPEQFHSHNGGRGGVCVPASFNELGEVARWLWILCDRDQN